jgi:PAS domain-containing protein
VDADGRYLLVNPAAERAAGLRTDQDVLPAGLVASLQDADRRVMATGLPHRSREELATPDGRRVYQALKAPWRGRIAVGPLQMTERVEALGGGLAVRARPGGGTLAEACIPGPEGRRG